MADITQTDTRDGDTLNQTNSQDGGVNCFGSEAEIQDVVRPWGRLTVRKAMANQPGHRAATMSASFSLNTEAFTIGRDRNCDWTITPLDVQKFWDNMSKTHCRIMKDLTDDSNPVYIEDLSMNGTFVNGEKLGIARKRILKTGDVISFCESGNRIFDFVNSHQVSHGFPSDILDRYHVGKTLGSGAQGMVRLVIDRRTFKCFAMKRVTKSGISNSLGGLNDEKIHREVEIMRNLNHPNIIRCKKVVMEPNAVYMILELMKGGDLLQRIQRDKHLSVDNSRHYFLQLCRAVKYLHDRNITHRDIKPDNILLLDDNNRTHLKLSDFGVSKLLRENSMLRTMCGTPMYMSPEIRITADRRAYTSKVDIWSLGVVLYVMLCGTRPTTNYGNTTAETSTEADKLNFKIPETESVPEMARQLIEQMLMVDPAQRPSIDDVIIHPWLQDKVNDFNGNFNISLHSDEEDVLEAPTKLRRIASLP